MVDRTMSNKTSGSNRPPFFVLIAGLAIVFFVALAVMVRVDQVRRSIEHADPPPLAPDEFLAGQVSVAAESADAVLYALVEADGWRLIHDDVDLSSVAVRPGTRERYEIFNEICAGRCRWEALAFGVDQDGIVQYAVRITSLDAPISPSGGTEFTP